jgi:glutamate/tyrosine decarboxylase-like PLP-dependent enzyme
MNLLESAAARAARYLADVGARGVAPSADAVAALGRLDGPLPDDPTDPHAVLALLDDAGSPATMAMAGPRFFGFVIGGALPVTVAASWLATAWDQNSALHEVTPATATLERVALGWLLELLGLPAGSGGAFVTGATVANFTALAAARGAVLKGVGWNVEADGLFGAPPVTVVVGEEAHPTLMKSLGLLGLGRRRVVRVPVDGQGRMRPGAIPPLDGPAIVCVQAGNVNTGAVDPVEEICDAVGAGPPGRVGSAVDAGSAPGAGPPGRRCGCTWTGRSGCGRRRRRRGRTWWPGWSGRIRGPRTRTSG